MMMGKTSCLVAFCAPLYPGNTSGTVDNYMLVDTDICGLRRTQGKFNRGSTESFRKLGFGILVR